MRGFFARTRVRLTAAVGAVFCFIASAAAAAFWVTFANIQESFYFVFGDDDVIVVVDMPDNATMAAVSLAISAAGGATTAVRVLLTPEEIDAATKKTIEYRAPGR